MPNSAVAVQPDPPPVIVPTTPDPAAPPVEADDPFATAFEQALADDTPLPPVEKKEIKAPEPPPDSGLPDPDAVAAAAKAAKAPVVAPEAAPAAPEASPVAPESAPAAPSVSDEGLLDRFREIVKEGVKDAQPAPAPVAEPQLPDFTAEERGVVDKYLADYPDVSRGEALIRRQEYMHFAQYIFQQMAPPLAHIAELNERLNALAGQTHSDAIYASIPDYETVAPKVVAWARSDEQPAYLRAAYEAVIQNGTPADVVDLFDRWRKSTGAAPAAPAAAPAAPTALAAPATPMAAPTAAAPSAPAAPPAAPAAPAVPTKDVNEAARRAAAALSPVGSKRSGISVDGLVDKDDFAGAFDTFSRQDS